MSRRSLRVASADVRSASASASDDDSAGGEPEAGGAGQCAHVLRLRATRAVTARITDPEQWACEQDGCGHTGLVWCCLTCGFVGCGAWAGHFERHAATRGPLHSVAIEVNEALVHCTLCDRELLDAEQPSHVRALLQELRALHEAPPPEFGALKAQSGSATDKLRTAEAAWRRRTLAHMFLRWKERALAAAPPESSDESEPADSSVEGTPEPQPASRSRLPKPRAGAMLLTRSSVKDVLRVRRELDLASESEASVAEDDDDDDDDEDDASSKLSGGRTKKAKLADKQVKKRTAGRVTAKSALTNKSDELTPGETGIRNLGNTCYLNAVLQSLAHLSEFRDFFLDMLIELQSNANVAGKPTPKKRPARSTASISGAASVQRNKMKRVDTATCLAELLESNEDEAVASPTSSAQKQASSTTTSSSSKKRPPADTLLSTQLYALLRVLWSGKWVVVTPHSLVETVWKHLPRYHNYLQHDAQEFFTLFLERIDVEFRSERRLCDGEHNNNNNNNNNNNKSNNESATRGKRMRRSSNGKLRSSSNETAATTTSSLKASSSSSICTGNMGPPNAALTHISCLFRGTLRSVVVCGGCKHRSKTDQPLWQLALDVPHTGVDALSNARRSNRIISPRRSAAAAAAVLCDQSSSVSLNSLVDRFLAIDELPPKCYACERCPTRQDATKQLEFAELPRVLVIVLKRFSWLSTSGAKIGTQVIFPLQDFRIGNSSYDLSSVVVHHGRSLRSGHYTAYARHDQRNRWLHFNDQKVTTVDESEVMQQQAYLLFYEKN